ncbi:hypothetical protein EMCRGX_G002011 [Ephydatia muelleri]
MRVLIYPYIPDLNKDGLKSLRNYIKKRAEEMNSDITVQVDGDPNLFDLYKLDNLRTYLGSGARAYDVVEVDTILLGELVTSNLIQPDPNPVVPVNDISFLRSAVDAVRYNGHQYGIPTLINDVIASKRSSFLAYAEVIGQALFTDAGLVIQSVRAPPFGGAGHLQMYTDALVANRNTYEAKKDAIKKFITFYTSINFRFEYAYCGDMDFKCIRYVLPAISGFYSLEKVEQNCLYSQLRDVFMTSDGGGDYTEEFATYRIDTGVPGHDNQPVFLRKHLASLRVLAL